MRKSNEQRINEVIDEIIVKNHMKEKLLEIRVINNWEKIVGSLISKNTSKIYFSKGKMFLHIDSPPLRQELNYSRSKIIELVNKEAGTELIDGVVVR